MSTGKQKHRCWRSGMLVGWWFSGHAASIIATVRSLCDVECCRRCGRVLASGCAVLLCLDLERISSYSSPFLKSDQLWSFFLFFFFYRGGHRFVKKLLSILFFVINSINISPCAEPMRKDAFHHFEKISALATSGCHYFVYTINQS